MNTVIGPIDAATWYCMRQCNEAIRFCIDQKDPMYDIEIKAEKELLKTFKDSIPRYTVEAA